MLDGPLLLPPLLLAILLVISGVAKVRAPAEVASAFAQLRLPAAISGHGVRTLFPWAEIALAVLLLVLPGPWSLVVAVGAALLMVVYLVIIVRALGFGYPITCGCFGRLGLGEVTRRTAVRNALLVALALLGAWSATSERSVVARLVDASGSTWVWLALLALTVAIVVVTFDGTSSAPADAEDVPAPSDEELEDYLRQPIPYGLLQGPSGAPMPLHELSSQSAHLLVFVSPGCGACAQVIPKVKEWDDQLPPVTVRAVVTLPLNALGQSADDLDGVVLHDPQGAVARTFAVGNPGAVLLGMDGMLAGGPVRGSAAVERLVADIRAELEDAGALSPEPDQPEAVPQPPSPAPAEARAPVPDPAAEWAGRPAPAGVLQDQEGAERSITELTGESSHLLVFVSPDCGSCTQVMTKIRGWDAELADVVVRAVVAAPLDLVSEHAPELDGIALHDPGAALSTALGVGTPGAVLIDSDARVTAGPVVGTDAVEQLVSELTARSPRPAGSASAGE